MAMRYCDVTHIRYEWGQSFDIEQLEQLSKNNTLNRSLFATMKQVPA